jgi:hypothetical protein
LSVVTVSPKANRSSSRRKSHILASASRLDAASNHDEERGMDDDDFENDDDLEETIAKLIYQMKAAPEDSATHRLIERMLEGLLGYEQAQPHEPAAAR